MVVVIIGNKKTIKLFGLQLWQMIVKINKQNKGRQNKKIKNKK